MNITVRDRLLVITFKYDERIVEVVRALPGRVFSVQKKEWWVSTDFAPLVVQKLGPLGFKISPIVLLAVHEAISREHRANVALQNPGAYQGPLPLMDFQKIGAVWMRERGSCLLADEPGLGKTIQTIATFEEWRKSKILVFVPNSNKFTPWEEEIHKWTKDTVTVINGTKDARAKQWLNDTRWYVANYELANVDYQIIKDLHFDIGVCDEATRLANPKTLTSQAIRALGIAERFALTGTPISNSPLDLWGIFHWLRPGLLGKLYEFRKEYCEINFFGQVTGYKNLDRLHKIIAPYILRRLKIEVLKELPPKTFQPVFFELSAKERKVYSTIQNGLRVELEENLSKVEQDSLAIMIVRMIRLKQITDHLQLVGEGDESTKLATLRDLLAPIVASGEKAIVFTQFAQMAEILARSEPFSTYNTPSVAGAVSTVDRHKATERFQNDPKCPFIIMTEAGSMGLNLQAASYVIHYDAPWSIAKLRQREDRAHRKGQKKPVTVYSLIAKNSIDEYIHATLFQKQELSIQALGDRARYEKAGLSLEDIEKILSMK